MLYHKSLGHGSPIVILHGLFGTGDNWRTFARMLEEKYQIILVDLRNHGRSFWTEEFNYELTAKDVVDLLNHLGIERAHILGHSMGGKVGLSIAQHYQSRVEKLIVIDISHKRYEGSHHQIFDAIFSLEPTHLQSRQEADERLGRSISDYAVRQFLLKNLSRNKEGGFKWKANFKSLYDNYEHILDQVTIDKIQNEVLFIRGMRSRYITEEEASQLRIEYTDAQVVDINAGHWVHAERPVELVDAVTSFL